MPPNVFISKPVYDAVMFDLGGVMTRTLKVLAAPRKPSS
jgi:hypothetical protein